MGPNLTRHRHMQMLIPQFFRLAASVSMNLYGRQRLDYHRTAVSAPLVLQLREHFRRGPSLASLTMTA